MGLQNSGMFRIYFLDANDILMFFKSKDPSQIRLSEIESYLKKKFSKELDEERKKIQSLVNSILSRFTEIKNAAEEMEKKHSEKAYAETIKNQYCDKCLGAIDGLREPDSSYAQTLSFVQISKLVLETVSNINLKEFKHLQEFKDTMSKISQNTKPIESEIKNLENFIYTSKTKKIEDIGNLINDVSRSRKTFDDMESMLRESSSAPNMLAEDISSLKKKLNAVRTNSSYASAESELRRVESQSSIMKQKIMTDLSIMDKIAKKLVHEGEKDALPYSKNSFEAFLEDNQKTLETILEKALAAISSGKISVDTKQKERTTKLSKNIDILSSMRNEYNDLLEHIQSLKDEISRKKEPAEKEIKRLETDIKEKEKELEIASKKRDSRIDERKKMEERTRKISDEIKKKLSEVLQKDVAVEF
ncbi:MAG TPA: hypothetical protein VI968_02080 [archaeon]|nr:hypothetical protein [archaeon]